MNTTVWDADFIYKGPMSVKVSCHSGDYGQRAICNAIGDQPLFYLSDADEEDLMLDYVSDATLDEMQAKLNTYDKAIKSLSDVVIEPTESKFDKMVSTPTKQTTLDNVISFGSDSCLFKSYLEFTRSNNIKIELSSSTETSFYHKDKEVIYLNPYLDVFAGSSSLIKAMRNVWNHKQGILINPLTFQPEETVLINRLFAADLDVTKIAYIWDLKLAGNDAVWNDAMSGSDYDLYSAYAVEAMADFRSIKNGLAARAAFEKWFISDRCKNYDREIIQVLLGNHAIHEIDTPITSRMVAMDIASRLGNRPIGKNYLSTIVQSLMTDSLFCEIRDRSNANFLWFVTFERRMAEMEQELQVDDLNSKCQSGNTTFEDNIYELPTIHGSHGENANTDTVATLFVLDHFRAG